MNKLYAFGIGLLFTVVLVLSLLPLRESITAIPQIEEEEEEEGQLMASIEGRFEQEFLMTRDPKLNRIPTERLLKAYAVAEEKRKAMQFDKSLPIYWEERGPNNVGGRTRALLFDANDATGRTVWAGGVSGGLWKTDDIDASPPLWEKSNDLFDNLAVSSIAQDPLDPEIMYFGTGEGWGNFDRVSGIGIWQSLDGGDSWNLLASSNNNAFRFTNRLLFDASGTLFAATSAGLYRYDPVLDSWGGALLNASNFANNNFIADLEVTATGNMLAAVQNDGIYRSVDQGTTWVPVMNGIPASNFGRIELAASPSNANVAYVILADTTTANSGNCLAIYRTSDGGNSWTARTCPGNFNKQGWYNLTLAVDPNDPNSLWCGGVGMSKSTDGAASWNSIGGVHSDHHAVVYRPGNSDEIVFGNDGGVYWTTNGSNGTPTLTAKNNSYNVTQFFALAIHPSAGSNYMLGGTQDNATPKFDEPGIESTDCVLCCCDGGWTFIDQDDPTRQIASTQDGSFSLSTDGGATFSNIIPSNDDRRFITPGDYDDAGNVLYISDTVNSFIRVTDIGGANTMSDELVTAFNGSILSALKVSPNTANRVYMATGAGELFLVDNAHQDGAVSVTDLNAPGSSYLSSIDVEVGDDQHLLITYSNYGVNSIWETTDGGTTWTSIEGDLPDMPIRWVMLNPVANNQALVATEVGVWNTSLVDGPATKWFPTNNFGLANVRVDMLEYRASDFLVGAATHGRGMFTTDYFSLLQNCPSDLNLSGMIASGLYVAENFITSNGTIGAGGKVIYQAGEEIILTDGFTAATGSDFWALIRECGNLSPLLPDEEPADVAQEKAKQSLTLPPTEQIACYPNPTRQDATIELRLPTSERVVVRVLDVRGYEREVLLTELLAEGTHQVYWNAANYESGLYLIQMKTPRGVQTVKVFVVK